MVSANTKNELKDLQSDPEELSSEETTTE